MLDKTWIVGGVKIFPMMISKKERKSLIKHKRKTQRVLIIPLRGLTAEEYPVFDLISIQDFGLKEKDIVKSVDGYEAVFYSSGSGKIKELDSHQGSILFAIKKNDGFKILRKLNTEQAEDFLHYLTRLGVYAY